MNNLKTSVALCTHNGQRWIAEQLQSILEQETPVDQIIISDDASSDETIAIARAILESNKTPFLFLENKERIGFIKNFEKAIQHASHEIIIFCDQDDIWEPQKVSIIRSRLSHSSWIASNALLITQDGNPIRKNLWDRVKFTPSRFSTTHQLAKQLLKRPVFTGATMACRKHSLESCLPFHPEMPHDLWISLVLTLTGNFPELSPQPLIRYRIHNAQQIGLRGNSWNQIAKNSMKSCTEGYLAEAQRCRDLLKHIRGKNQPFALNNLELIECKIRHMEARARLGCQPFHIRFSLVMRELLSGRYSYSWTWLAPLKDILRPRKEAT